MFYFESAMTFFTLLCFAYKVAGRHATLTLWDAEDRAGNVMNGIFFCVRNVCVFVPGVLYALHFAKDVATNLEIFRKHREWELFLLSKY